MEPPPPPPTRDSRLSPAHDNHTHNHTRPTHHSRSTSHRTQGRTSVRAPNAASPPSWRRTTTAAPVPSFSSSSSPALAQLQRATPVSVGRQLRAVPRLAPPGSGGSPTATSHAGDDARAPGRADGGVVGGAAGGGGNVAPSSSSSSSSHTRGGRSTSTGSPPPALNTQQAGEAGGNARTVDTPWGARAIYPALSLGAAAARRREEDAERGYPSTGTGTGSGTEPVVASHAPSTTTGAGAEIMRVAAASTASSPAAHTPHAFGTAQRTPGSGRGGGSHTAAVTPMTPANLAKLRRSTFAHRDVPYAPSQSSLPLHSDERVESGV